MLWQLKGLQVPWKRSQGGPPRSEASARSLAGERRRPATGLAAPVSSIAHQKLALGNQSHCSCRTCSLAG